MLVFTLDSVLAEYRVEVIFILSRGMLFRDISDLVHFRSSIIEFFLSVKVICQVIMLCYGVLIVYYSVHHGRMGPTMAGERSQYLNKIFANTKTKPTYVPREGYNKYESCGIIFDSQSIITSRLNFLFHVWSTSTFPNNHSVITRSKISQILSPTT